jgi:hypothetical protein
MAQVPTEPVEFPQHKCVAGLDRLETGRKAGAVVTAARCQVLLDAGGVNASGENCVPLRRELLGAVGLRVADIADEHRGTARKDAAHRAILR